TSPARPSRRAGLWAALHRRMASQEWTEIGVTNGQCTTSFRRATIPRASTRPEHPGLGILHSLGDGVNILVTFSALASDCANQGRPCMTDTVGIAGDRIRSIVERIEHIEEEIKALNEGRKEVFQEAKGEGFDLKVI